jgi:hypothetical protein
MVGLGWVGLGWVNLCRVSWIARVELVLAVTVRYVFECDGDGAIILVDPDACCIIPLRPPRTHVRYRHSISSYTYMMLLLS